MVNGVWTECSNYVLSTPGVLIGLCSILAFGARRLFAGVCVQCLYFAHIGAFWCAPCECLHRVLIAGNRVVLLRWLAYRHEKTRVVIPGFIG